MKVQKLRKLLNTLMKRFAFKPSKKRGAIDFMGFGKKSRCGRFMGVVFSGH